MSFNYKLQQYLRYKLRAKNEFSLHSPFMFDLYNAVFKKANKRNAEFDFIEHIRKHILKNHQVITINDLGAGSMKSNSYVRKISSIAKTASKPKKYARFLAELAYYMKSKNILELGTSLGFSTMYIAKKNSESVITSIEGSHEIQALALLNFNQSELKNINTIVGDFDKVLPDLLSKYTYDLIFIDGNHTYEATIRYFEWIKTHSSTNTVIIFDDIYWDSNMTKAWKKIIEDKRITATIDMFEFGIVFFNDNLAKQDFCLRY